MHRRRDGSGRRGSKGGVVALAAAVALAAGACNQSPTGPSSGSPSLTLLLKDAPGQVAHAWVSVSRITLQGSASDAGQTSGTSGGGIVLLDGSTGLIDLTQLADSTHKLVEDQTIPAGTYSQLRLVVDSAVLESADGVVYSLNGAVPPGGSAADITGELRCPSCQQSGLKVQLPGGALDLKTGSTIVVLDFNVDESFGHVAGKSGAWVMHPVIHTSTVQTQALPGVIAGTVSLGDAVTLPTCGGADRTLADFVPTATANLTGSDTTVAGATQSDGTYAIDGLQPTKWKLGYEAKVGLDGDTLLFTATPSADSVTVVSGDTANADYTITAASCQAGGSQSTG